MFRVRVRVRGAHGNWGFENGPWLPTKAEAEAWAEALRRLGYYVRIEPLGRAA